MTKLCGTEEKHFASTNCFENVIKIGEGKGGRDEGGGMQGTLLTFRHGDCFL